MIKLSICIPTYNRANFISETLDSIVKQATDEIEIIISDNASQDNTKDVVSYYQSQFPQIIYHCNKTNIGASQNYLKVVELAKGEFCWLFGSDDIFEPGAISEMLSEISSGDDIYLCNATLCDIKMEPIRQTTYLATGLKVNHFNLSDRGQLLQYLSFAKSNSALFCYLSVIVFRRSCWKNVQYDERFNATAYSHVFMLLSFIKKSCVLRYIPKTLVMNRGDNDSFSNEGIEKRYLLDFDGYLLLADKLFNGDSELRSTFLKVMTREHPWYRILKLRSAIKSADSWALICEKLTEFGYTRLQLTCFTYLGQASLVIDVALYFNKKYSKTAAFRWLRRLL